MTVHPFAGSLWELIPEDLREKLDGLPGESLDRILGYVGDRVKMARSDDPLGEWWKCLTDEQRAFVYDPSPEKFLYGGNRSGKTFTGCGIDCCIATGWYPEGFPERYRFDNTRPRTVWVCCPSRKVQVEPGGVQETITRMLPAGVVRRKYWAEQNALAEIELWDNSRIIFKVYASGPDAFMSAAVQHIHWDEEPRDRTIWIEAYQRGLEQYGTNILTLTPWMGLTWMYEEFEKPGLVPIHYIKTEDNPVVSKEEMNRRDRFLTRTEKLVRRLGMRLPMIRVPRFDVEKIADQMDQAHDPKLWVQLTEHPDHPIEYVHLRNLPPIIVTECERETPGALGVYIDPRGLVAPPLDITRSSLTTPELEEHGWENRFVIGADSSEGVQGGDDQASVIWDRLLQTEAAISHGIWDIEEWAKMLLMQAIFYGAAHICPEINGPGIIPARYLVRRYGRVWVREKGTTTTGEVTREFGYRMHHGGKVLAEGRGQTCITELGTENGGRLKYPNLLGQIMTYEKGPTGTGEAVEGTHDDLVIAWLLALMMDSPQAGPIREPNWRKQEADRKRMRDLRRGRRKKKTTWMGN